MLRANNVATCCVDMLRSFGRTLVPEVFFSLGATELSGTYSDVPCRWRARRPLASRVVWPGLYSEKVYWAVNFIILPVLINTRKQSMQG